MADCLWGCLDGMNDAGLAVSLSFGGRRVVGGGFGIPVVLRYALEFCATAAEAVAVLRRVPVHMAYNVTVVDRSGAFGLRVAGPAGGGAGDPGGDEAPGLRRVAPPRPRHRERFLLFRLSDAAMTPEKLAGDFLRPPLHARAYGRGFGTLYTAAYRPRRGEVQFRWSGGGAPWSLSFEGFREGTRRIRFQPETA